MQSCPSDLWPLGVLQLVQDGSLHLGHVQYFVLDECDKMLETTGGHPVSAELQSSQILVPHRRHDCPWMAFQVILGFLAACLKSLPPLALCYLAFPGPMSGHLADPC